MDGRETLSVETYLSFVNYEGLGARGVPIVGHIMTWREEPFQREKVDWVKSRAKWHGLCHSQHWAQEFQKQFSKWLSGKGPEPRQMAYTREELRAHLERQFTRGMRWENYAGALPYRSKTKSWVVDHIVPKRLFGVEEADAAYALTNLRPLWIDKNIRKGGTREHLL
jgi:hypothetical protein